MTSPIRTQCPHCHNFFDVPRAHLNRTNAKGRCGHCQQVFLINNYLVVSANHQQTDKNRKISVTKQNPKNNERQPASTTSNPDTQADKVSTTNNSHNSDDSNIYISKPAKKAETDLDDDILIHDDMDIDETAGDTLVDDSSDGMDLWLAQTSTVTDSLPTSNKPQKTSPKMSEKPALSSAEVNDIHASIKDTSDNTWLEQLIKEQNDHEDVPQADTDLPQLLIKMGVPVNDEDKVNQERTSKIQARMQSTQTQIQISITALLWTTGCVVLVLLLFAQYVIFNLDTLIKNPAYAERLQTLCSIAACSLPSADLTTLRITDLNHRASQVSTTSAFSDVRATLSNQSSQAQLLPNLKISVHSSNALIREFIAMPDDYLLSPQYQLAAESSKQLMFTIAIADNQIDHVTIDPIY
ncbi:zinc-ribbon and DUF3426 domain-containing protein [Psychrobacter sp. LV10R520-6]|uniref:zinc-ribbon and DUF3426 domain-containing protein n=1 Tax=Psychrobacter sp. LV10R520-6 TaxID=1415574 RepID=UPI0024CA5767|nr:zinc-ribbon and DUF3426 domain-containing protein [Psychrobacter sp. LV10R520-6]SNT69475.1 MJ0042 family finger-like domain-containing protein [Psychrobacter sp. LV10R520-6]